MEKYTPATALAIKRDVEMSQQMLVALNQEIEFKQNEAQAIDTILAEKRSLLTRFEETMGGVFLRNTKRNDALEQKKGQLTDMITKMETARDLLTAEIKLSHEQVREPKGAVLVQSLISQLKPILDKLLMDIDVSEKELHDLEKKSTAFVKAHKKLATELEIKQAKVKRATSLLEQADRERNKALKELARETQQLEAIRIRENESNMMNQRLSKEYLDVYNSMPRRGQ